MFNSNTNYLISLLFTRPGKKGGKGKEGKREYDKRGLYGFLEFTELKEKEPEC